MPKYDELYPEAPLEFVSMRQGKQPPVIKFDWTKAGDRTEQPVCACGTPTSWVNSTAMQFVCSTECNQKVWDNLINAFVATQISGVF